MTAAACGKAWSLVAGQLREIKITGAAGPGLNASGRRKADIPHVKKEDISVHVALSRFNAHLVRRSAGATVGLLTTALVVANSCC